VKANLTHYRLFRVTNTTLSQPVFYVEAENIVRASIVAESIVKEMNEEKKIIEISEVAIELLRLTNEHTDTATA